MNLIDLGWNEFFASGFEPFKSRGLKPGRIAEEHRELYEVFCEEGQFKAEVSGKFRFEAQSRADFPAVGDWVAVNILPQEERAIIHAVLPRKSAFSRRAVLSGGMPETGGRTDEQVLAANIDTLFLVSGLDNDFNLRRIERYLSAAWDSGAMPVVVLNKADICDDVAAKIGEVEQVAPGVDILSISAATKEGLENVRTYLKPGRTAALLGSSGVGKTSIINCLLGENRMKTTEVRVDDSRGRHTTTHREMIILPEGGIVIDTPGLRSFKVWDGEEGIARLFDDIEKLALRCRFADCSHTGEPGCAIQSALSDGSLDPKRYENYRKLQKEQRFLASRKNQRDVRKQQRAMGKRFKQYHKMMSRLKNKGLI